MKTIFIARHAKSSWRNNQLNDMDRPLKSSGVVAAGIVAQKLRSSKINLDAIYSSPAIRAIHTAIIHARTLEFPENRVEIRNSIYFKGKEGIYELLKTVNRDYNSLMITGHDPTLTNFLNDFMAVPIEKIQTSGIVRLQIDSKDWDIKDAPVLGITYFKRDEIRELKYAKKKS